MSTINSVLPAVDARLLPLFYLCVCVACIILCRPPLLFIVCTVGRHHAGAKEVRAQLHGPPPVPAAEVRLPPTDTARVIGRGRDVLSYHAHLWGFVVVVALSEWTEM